jgi:uncharacterized membrane protein (UPF0127 family)
MKIQGQVAPSSQKVPPSRYPLKLGIWPSAFQNMNSTAFMASLTARKLRHAGALALASLTLAAFAQQSPQLQLPRTKLNAGMHVLDVQLAQTPEQRQIGLMWRKEMPQHEGMLFVFEQPATQCFWMRNTLIPLSAAFVADDGTIVNIADMKPQSDDSHCSDKPVRYVLEMNVGWFAKRQLKAGYKLGGSAFTR